MGRFAAKLSQIVNAILFGLALIAFFPLVLFHETYMLPSNWLCDRIRAKWPNSERAETIRLWIKIGWPLAVLAVMAAVLLAQLLSD